MECLVTRFMVMILREFGVNSPRIKVISVKVMEMDGPVWGCDSFDKFVEEAWSAPFPYETNAMVRFIKKLKHLKQKVRSWVKVKKHINRAQKLILKGTVADIDSVLDKGDVNSNVLNMRLNVVKSLQDLDKLDSLEVAKKAKIKCSIEGDENSKYFHGVLNKKRNQLAIHCILVEGAWIDSLIWYWNIIETDVMDAVSYFSQYGSFPSGGNSSFIALIPKMQDAKMLKWDFHLLFQNVVNEGMFKGVSIGTTLHLSHLFYAVDVVFMGQWSDSNISTIVHVLNCFFKASGLRIKVGGMMSRIKSWDEIVKKMLARLSKWKMKTLSIGGRLTLLKSVLVVFNGVEDNEKKLSWVRWKSMLASKEKEGLGVSSFYAFNSALLIKWEWHFRNDNKSLWARVIQAVHGEDGSLSNFPKSSRASIWLDIVRDLTYIKKQWIDLLGLIKKKMESFKKIIVTAKLAHDNLGYSLRRYPRGRAELGLFSELSTNMVGFQLSVMQDR
ncbi:hypothetical protein Tco_1312800 [Tanacetum coccineum]